MQTNESEVVLKKWYQEYGKQVLQFDRFPEIINTTKKKTFKEEKVC
jgi:hypothetical protein